MGHNVVAHAVLAIIIFAASTLFLGGGIYSALFFTTSDIAATLSGATSDPGASAENLEGIIPIIVTVVVNIVLYYLIAGVIIFLFNMVRRK